MLTATITALAWSPVDYSYVPTYASEAEIWRVDFRADDGALVTLVIVETDAAAERLAAQIADETAYHLLLQ